MKLFLRFGGWGTTIRMKKAILKNRTRKKNNGIIVIGCISMVCNLYMGTGWGRTVELYQI